MRHFMVECKDSKTGYSMVLSECSYNMACDWLSKEIGKYGVEIYRTEKHITDDTKLSDIWEIWTGKFRTDTNDYEYCRRYFYDEERGYLLGE